MTPEEFVAALRKVVLLTTVNSTLSVLERPPGRAPGRELIELSSWYKGLVPEERAMLQRVATMVARQAVFGVLAVLDGVRPVESTPEKGNFRLVFQKGGREWALNPPDGVALHDLLNQVMASSD